MKKIILIILLITVNASAQSWSKRKNQRAEVGQEVAFRVDWSNALYGSPVNRPAFNYMISYSDVANYWKRTRIELFFEQFKEIEYIQVGVKFKHDFKFRDWVPYAAIIKNVSIRPGLEFGVIYRSKKLNYARNALNYGYVLEVVYDLPGNFKLSVELSREQAADVSQDFRDSAYGGLIYTF